MAEIFLHCNEVVFFQTCRDAKISLKCHGNTMSRIHVAEFWGAGVTWPVHLKRWKLVNPRRDLNFVVCASQHSLETPAKFEKYRFYFVNCHRNKAADLFTRRQTRSRAQPEPLYTWRYDNSCTKVRCECAVVEWERSVKELRERRNLDS